MIYNFTLGTICSFICAILMAWSTFSKNKKEMAKIQIFNPIFGALSNFFLCSYSAVVTNIVNVIRNYLTYKEKIIFNMYYINDLSIKEISKKVNTKETNIKYFLYSARNKIKEKYGE